MSTQFNSIFISYKLQHKKFFFFDKQECLKFFEYLIILLGVYSPPVLHTPDYYKDEFYCSPRMLVRDFELKIS